MRGQPISIQTALVYGMILVSAADAQMGNGELARIGELVRRWPVFAGFNQEMLVPMAGDCASIVAEQDGVATVLGLIAAAIPAELTDTAYALACEVAATDSQLLHSEMQVLDLLRAQLGLDRLTAAALERAALARNRRIET
jgi:tellurite resistance protein